MRKGKKPQKNTQPGKRKGPVENKDSGSEEEFERHTQEDAELVPRASRPQLKRDPLGGPRACDVYSAAEVHLNTTDSTTHRFAEPSYAPSKRAPRSPPPRRLW